MTKEFIERLKKLEKICPHFHLSLQSGCDSTLKRMNRRYTKEKIIEVVQNLRKNFKEVILTADIIVGFPGETKEEFEETYNLLKNIKLYKIHVFQYSKRENTKAAGFEGQVDPKVKEERSKMLIELSQNNQVDYNRKYIGEIVEVLVEEKEGADYKGHTKNYINVLIKKVNNDVCNSIVNVKIVDVQNENLHGELI